MKICVVGAGAVGGHIAARMARGGADVSVVARGPHLAAMQARGLEIHATDATFTVPVTAVQDPALLGPQDAVIVSLKAPSLPAMAPAIAPLLGPQTAVVFALNGIPWWYFYKEGSVHDGFRLDRLDPGGVIWDAIGPQRVIGGVISSACTVVAPGVIEVANAVSRITLGEPDGSPSARAEAIGAAMIAGGMEGPVVSNIRTKIWEKLMLNIGSGPMAVLTQSTAREVFVEDACCDALRAIAREIEALSAAMGCPIKPNPEAQIAASRKLSHTSSIVQDLLLGRPMEIDGIFAMPVELARLVGVPTPRLDLLVALAKVRGRAAGLY